MIFWYDNTCMNKLGSYVKIGVPAVIFTLIDSWFFDIINILAGVIGVGDLACLIIFSQWMCLICVIPYGIKYSA